MNIRGWVDKIRRHNILHYIEDRTNIIGIDHLYGKSYYDRMHQALEDNDFVDDTFQFYHTLDQEFHPDSVLDLGCGIGHFLKPFHDNGTYVYGVDGSQYAIETGIIPRDQLTVHNLEEPFDPERQFDLVLCIEVLEHLSPESADTIVNTIATSGQTAVVSAAPPGQGGSYHINERNADYWIDKFNQEGMYLQEGVTNSIKERYDPKKIQYRGDNLMVFQHQKGQ